MSHSNSPKKTFKSHTRSNTLTGTTVFSSNPSTPIRNPNYSHPALESPDPAQHISPTKAAAQSRLNHEINTIITWLEILFAPNPIPPRFLKWRDEVLNASSAFDSGLISNDSLGTPNRVNGLGKGEGVLETLKAIKQANLAADYLNDLVHEARGEELRWLEGEQSEARRQREERMIARVVLDEVLDRLSTEGRGALEDLSATAVILGIDQREIYSDEEMMVNTYLKKLLNLANRKVMLEEQTREMQRLEMSMQSTMCHQGNVGLPADGVEMHDGQGEPIHAQAARYNRDTKQVNLKIMEYEDRVRGLERQLSAFRMESINLQDVIDSRAKVENRKTRVKEMQQRFAAFYGLPADLEASRGEVRRAMNELEALKNERDKLFERVGSV